MSNDISRRGFLQGIGAAAGLAACGRTRQLFEPSLAKPAKPILVVVNLDGGNDWLNMLPPTTGSNRAEYERCRPSLKVPANGITEIGDGVGLSNHFFGMERLSNLGQVAWILGVGMQAPNLSHFVSIDLWGQGAAEPNGTGWLGRYADAAFRPGADAMRGVALTSDVPIMLRGAVRDFVSITDAKSFQFPTSLWTISRTAPWDSQLLLEGYRVAASSSTGDRGYEAAAATSRMFLETCESFPGGSLPPREPSVLYPGDLGYDGRQLGGRPLDSGLSEQLKLIAQMLAGGIDAEVFFVRIGGWDTHVNQLVDHPNLMRALGGSLAAFYEDLSTVSTPSGNAADRTVILAWSEFGRRVRENQTGTDHGTAGLAFCIGRAVKGGFYGEYPDLADLDEHGNMRFTVDFRSLYATVLERWLGRSGRETDAILGASYPRLEFV